MQKENNYWWLLTHVDLLYLSPHSMPSPLKCFLYQFDTLVVKSFINFTSIFFSEDIRHQKHPHQRLWSNRAHGHCRLSQAMLNSLQHMKLQSTWATLRVWSWKGCTHTIPSWKLLIMLSNVGEAGYTSEAEYAINSLVATRSDEINGFWLTAVGVALFWAVSFACGYAFALHNSWQSTWSKKFNVHHKAQKEQFGADNAEQMSLTNNPSNVCPMHLELRLVDLFGCIAGFAAQVYCDTGMTWSTEQESLFILRVAYAALMKGRLEEVQDIVEIMESDESTNWHTNRNCARQFAQRNASDFHIIPGNVIEELQDCLMCVVQRMKTYNDIPKSMFKTAFSLLQSLQFHVETPFDVITTAQHRMNTLPVAVRERTMAASSEDVDMSWPTKKRTCEIDWSHCMRHLCAFLILGEQIPMIIYHISPDSLAQHYNYIGVFC